MNVAKEYDVFIAFHNSGKASGSQSQAHRLSEYLHENGIKCFMFSSREESAYKANFIKIMQSKLFLFVCNETLERTKNGELDYRKNYHLNVEKELFDASMQWKTNQ